MMKMTKTLKALKLPNKVSTRHTVVCTLLIALEHDPFVRHIADVDEAQLKQRIENVKQDNYSTAKPTLQSGLVCVSKIPYSSDATVDSSGSKFQSLNDIPVGVLPMVARGYC